MGYFSHISIHWRINTAEHKKSRRVLVCIHDKFLTQVVKMSAREDSVLDLKVTNRKDLVWGEKARDSFGCNDYEMVKFKILDRRNQAKSRITTFYFRRADFILLRDLLRRVP